MIAMKVRYEIVDVDLKISNVHPRDMESYVLMTASDGINEIVFSLSHEQAEHLQNELYETNRRRKSSKPIPPSETGAETFSPMEVQ